MGSHRVSRPDGKRWCEVVDMDFVEYLTHVIVEQDPTIGCRRRGTALDWYGLPREKSLFYSSPGCGMPIGNLTSQLFSNVYLNELDQYAKRHLHCRHYGRYVDDFYVVSANRDWLRSLQRPLTDFLESHLNLTVNSGKTVIVDVRQGVEFLGAFLKPHRRYVSNRTLHRMRQKILGHYRSYRLRREMFYNLRYVYQYGYYLHGMKKYMLFDSTHSMSSCICELGCQ